MKGFIRQLASILGLVVGLAGSKGFVCNVGGEALSGCDRLDDGCAGIGFYCHLDRCSADIHVSGVLADESDGAISLGWLNRWLGSGLGALKFLLLTSLVICVIEFIDSDNKLISATKKSESLLYYPMETFAGIFFPAAKNITQQYILDNKDATRRTQ